MTRHKKILVFLVILFILTGLSFLLDAKVGRKNRGNNNFNSYRREEEFSQEEAAGSTAEPQSKAVEEVEVAEDSVSIKAELFAEDTGTEKITEEAANEAALASDINIELLSEKEEYLARLERLAMVLEANFQNSKDTTTTGMRTAKNQELIQWDNELNKIYKMLKEKLPEDEFIVLRDEERQWIVERDEKANAAAAEYEGGTLAGLEYLSVQVETTKERTYELVELYFAE